MEPNTARKSGTEKVSESYANLYATKLPACLPASDLCGQDREPGNFHFSASPCVPFLLKNNAAQTGKNTKQQQKYEFGRGVNNANEERTLSRAYRNSNINLMFAFDTEKQRDVNGQRTSKRTSVQKLRYLPVFPPLSLWPKCCENVQQMLENCQTYVDVPFHDFSPLGW